MAVAGLMERRRLSSRRRLDAILEIVGAYTLLTIVNLMFWGDDLGWVESILHPYFLIVLLVAGRYGTIDGLVAGALGASLHLAFHIAADPAAFSTAGALLDLELMRVPYLLLLVGTLLGEVRQITEDEIQELLARLGVLRGDMGTISGEAVAVRKYNEELQERIASSTQTTGAFYEAAADVQSLGEDEAINAILSILQQFIGAEKCAMYVRGHDSWELRMHRGWSAPDEFGRTLPLTHPLLQKVDENEVATVLDVQGAKGSDVLIAAPLWHEDGAGRRQIHAALTVQLLPLTSLNAGTIRNLAGVAQWASQVLLSVERYERVRERDPSDDATGTFRFGYMMRRLEEECGRWRRYHTPMTLLLLKVVNYNRIPRRKRVAFLRRAGRLLLRNIRSVDIVSRWKSADTLAVIMPSTDADGARILAGRLAEQFHREVLKDVPRSAELSLSFGVATTGEHGDSREELIRSAERMELHN